MKFVLNKFDDEYFEEESYAKIKSKKRKLTDRQSVTRLVSTVRQTDVDAPFENSDLNELHHMDCLDELICGIKTGKEASVFLGRNSKGLVAVKMYTDIRVRSFKNDAAYRQGRFIGDARLKKAIDHRSHRGLDAHQALWVQEEFAQMKHLREHGVRVPREIAVNGLALVMEFIGDENGLPAPRISDLRLEKAEAEEAFRQSIQNLKRIVAAGRVHGDYSTFNILWHRGEAVVIDFPQVMDLNANPNAKAFLERDIRSLCGSFHKLGIAADERKIMREIRAR